MSAAAGLEMPPGELAGLRRRAIEAGRSLVSLIEQRFELDHASAVAALARWMRLPVLSDEQIDAATPAFDVLSFSDSARLQIILLRTSPGQHVLATPDPLDAERIAWLGRRIPGQVHVHVVDPERAEVYFRSHEQSLRALDQISDTSPSEDGPVEAVTELSLASVASGGSAAVRTVDSMVYDALAAGASDIHFEMLAGGMTIKYRIDGVLVAVASVASRIVAEQVVSRLKVLSELDISERRVPQDGRFRIAARGRTVDLRVSVMPSIHGEDVVVRILDRASLTAHMGALRLEDLGFSDAGIAEIRRLSREPYGMLLVTGPTGSGKTTTLYAAMGEINSERDKIITIEDPVEYRLDGVLQIPVNEKKGLTFARGLRSILRHDPDKILVGEIRDAETAQIAVQSALTGHAVFTTVHANNALDVLGRVVNMGVDAYTFLSALNGVVGQRLIRGICPHCREDRPTPAAELESMGIDPSAQDACARLAHGTGCTHCRGTGYRGRRAIAEVVVMDDELRAAFLRNTPPAEIKAALRRRGVRFLREQAIALALNGETTLEEVNRVTLAQ